jgi:hypothetical protein
MSFLRHQEIYQVSEPRFTDGLLLERARPRGHALTHRLDESPVGYSWRVALQQSPLPLHQPEATLQQCRGELQECFRWNVNPTLTRCLTFGAHPSSRAKHGTVSTVSFWSIIAPYQSVYANKLFVLFGERLSSMVLFLVGNVLGDLINI